MGRSQKNQISLLIGAAVVARLFFTSVFAMAFPLPKTLGYLFDNRGNIVKSSNSKNINWKPLTSAMSPKVRGVGMLYSTANTTCTGTLIDVGGDRNAPAYLLTAGHCYGIPVESSDSCNTKLGWQTLSMGDVVTSKPAPYYIFVPNLFTDSKKSERKPIRVKSVAYATKRSTDLAIFELDATVGSLLSRGLSFHKLAKKSLDTEEEVEVYGVPLLKNSKKQVHLYKSECKTEQPYNLAYREQGRSNWYIRMIPHQCSTIGGVSGAPLFNKNSGDIVGIVALAGGKPAEAIVKLFSESEVTLESSLSRHPKLKFVNHAADTSKLLDCFSQDGFFRLENPNCRLEKPCGDFDKLNCARWRCESGDGRGCFDAAESSVGLQKSIYLEEGCKLDDSLSCNRLAYLGARGLRNFNTVTTLEYGYALKACHLGHLDACALAAVFDYIEWQGEVAPVAIGDAAILKQRSRSFADRACAGQNGLGCLVLGQILMKDQSPQAFASSPGAADAYFRGCFWGNGTACKYLAFLYQEGKLEARYPIFEKSLLGLACRSGDQEACVAMRELPN